MTCHTLSSTVALVTAAALALTACSGDDAKTSGQATGAPSTPSTTTPTRDTSSPSATARRPVTDLPSDLKMVFVWPKTGNTTQDAVLNDGEQYIRALKRASAKNDLTDPGYAFYSRNDGRAYARSQIQANITGGWAPTGDDRYYDAKADVFKAGSATLSFCRDQSKVFSKNVETGAVVRTSPNAKSFVLYNLLLVTDTASHGVWQTTKITVIAGAPQCRG
ncbi:hypothetical protein QMK19_34590 [Streptomyces sp. H10-C2]|uniref:hypothetical protein n=1 Tax=unclassified Streptomyces TaxID=2593676 RepID=UPI0024B8DF22|nr:MULTISPECIES: hypothetical protein [unclassified Streptomyces]MDJ0346707.1 hypothetical protein [Streptomyces sp. PH10-H1]MDJ0374615.1 hypothetical protein [Streptomyces sp. H10-C2]